VVFTASVSGLVGSMFSPIYSAAKFAVVGLTKSLALAFAKDGVRVNVVCPGLAETPMKSGFTSRSGNPVEAEANEARLLANVPMGRLCRAEEAAHAALWLASDDASFVTGVALPVDGGFTAR
jgi:NAD(P)-dependent dehydrogenase (short-subunit alcohol dehydrogenase family)